MRWSSLPNEQENQAKKLQQLFHEVEKNEPTEKKVKEEPDLIEIDVLNLPPRKEVHQSPKQKLTINLDIPFVRFLFVFLILIVIIFAIYIVAGNQIMMLFTSLHST